jgi:cobalamin biosynthesis protein CobW
MTTFAKIPVTIVTGFLGAGKTTLIRHLIENARGRRLALIVNEFGDVGIDGEILRSCANDACAADAIVELANGCLCCTVADDFMPAIEGLLALPNRPDHIVVETSGLALPKPLIKAFDWPEIRAKLTVDGVVAVVDGRAVADGRFADDPAAVLARRAEDTAVDHDNPLEEVYEDQLLAADLVVVNKADLLDAGALAALEAEIRTAIPRAVKVVSATEGRVDPAVALGLVASAEDDLAARPSHHEAEGEDHDHDDFTTFVVDVAPAADPESLVARLAAVVEAHDVLRVKGWVAVSGRPMRLLVQGVGARFQHRWDRPWGRDEARAGRLVVIAEKGLDEAAVRAALAA